jgi:2'-5' RNA ligase
MAHRAFVALELPGPVRARVFAAGRAYVDADPAWAGEKWVAEENLHVTLGFIGALHEADVDAVTSELASATAGERPFSLRLARVVAVPGARQARMVWAETDGEVDACARLAAAVEDALAARLPENEQPRRFRPHVTMARARKRRAVSPEALDVATTVLTSGDAVVRGVVSVRSVTLFSSTLGPGGPTYEALAQVPIGRD